MSKRINNTNKKMVAFDPRTEKAINVTIAQTPIARHYRLYGGDIACGIKSSRIDATSVPEGVTCLRCQKFLVNKSE